MYKYKIYNRSFTVTAFVNWLHYSALFYTYSVFSSGCFLRHHQYSASILSRIKLKIKARAFCQPPVLVSAIISTITDRNGPRSRSWGHSHLLFSPFPSLPLFPCAFPSFPSPPLSSVQLRDSGELCTLCQRIKKNILTSENASDNNRFNNLFCLCFASMLVFDPT